MALTMCNKGLPYRMDRHPPFLRDEPACAVTGLYLVSERPLLTPSIFAILSHDMRLLTLL